MKLYVTRLFSARVNICLFSILWILHKNHLETASVSEVRLFDISLQSVLHVKYSHFQIRGSYSISSIFWKWTPISSLTPSWQKMQIPQGLIIWCKHPAWRKFLYCHSLPNWATFMFEVVIKFGRGGQISRFKVRKFLVVKFRKWVYFQGPQHELPLHYLILKVFLLQNYQTFSPLSSQAQLFLL